MLNDVHSDRRGGEDRDIGSGEGGIVIQQFVESRFMRNQIPFVGEQGSDGRAYDIVAKRKANSFDSWAAEEVLCQCDRVRVRWFRRCAAIAFSSFRDNVKPEE
jgi:hypothetical protein